MSTLELEFYDVIKKKLGEKESKMLLELMEQKVDKEFTKQSTGLATQTDLANLKTDIIKWMFIFWIGTVGTIMASLIGIFKLAGVL